MRISDWSSDVCSSDLIQGIDETRCQAQGDTHRIGLHMSAPPQHHEYAAAYGKNRSQPPARPGRFTGDGNLKQAGPDWTEIGRASGRERGCQYVEIPVVAVSLKKKKDRKKSKTE